MVFTNTNKSQDANRPNLKEKEKNLQHNNIDNPVIRLSLAKTFRRLYGFQNC